MPQCPSSEAAVKTLRLAVPLLLAAFTLTCQSDQTPVSPDTLSPVFASCGDPPCGRGPGGGGGSSSFALSFDGNDGTETPDANDLDLTNTFTVEGWIKPDQPAGLGFQDIIVKWGGSVSASYSIAFENDGRFDLVTHDPSANPDNTKIFSTAGAFVGGEWQHFAIVFDGGQAWLYVDGVLNSSCGGALGNCWHGNTGTQTVASMNTPQVTTTPVSIGRQNSPEGFIGDHYRGVMDEIRVWNVARTAKQVRQNMNKSLNLKKANGLVAYWRMNEGSGQVAADASGNGHNLQLGNTGGGDAADPAWVSPGKP